MSQSKLSALKQNKKPTATKGKKAHMADLLEVDKPIAGQAFGCYSFISPDKIIKQKEMFFFEEFIKVWDFSKSMEKFTLFLNFLSYKYKLTFDDVIKDYEEFIRDEKVNIVKASIEDDYKTFIDNKEEALEAAFNAKHEFQTSVKGFKSRGNFATQEEAELRAKILRKIDPDFDIFVGPVGQWLCWDPEAYKTGRVEYMEEELNQLAHEKANNASAAKAAFDKRVKDSKQQAIDDNVKKAEKSGSSITQTINSDGQLVSIDSSNTQEASIIQSSTMGGSSEEVSSDAVKEVLFGGDNVVTGKTDNGISQLVSGPFASSSASASASASASSSSASSSSSSLSH